jgi:hypothetical protein
VNIRIDSGIMCQAKVAAVGVEKTPRQRFEEAKAEKIARERWQGAKRGVPASLAFFTKGHFGN